MLPSMRHFLKFIDAYEKWDAHGFNVKVRSEYYGPFAIRSGAWVANSQGRTEVPFVLTGPDLKHVSPRRPLNRHKLNYYG